MPGKRTTIIFGKISFISFFFLFHFYGINAQSITPYVISSSAGVASNAQIELNSNPGELISSTLSSNGITFTQGFLQPEIYTVGIPEFNPINLYVFPNPFSDSFTMRIEGSDEALEVKLYSLSGQIVFQSKLNTGVNLYQPDLPALNSGYYFLNILGVNSGRTYQFKLVKL